MEETVKIFLENETKRMDKNVATTAWWNFQRFASCFLARSPSLNVLAFQNKSSSVCWWSLRKSSFAYATVPPPKRWLNLTERNADSSPNCRRILSPSSNAKWRALAQLEEFRPTIFWHEASLVAHCSNFRVATTKPIGMLRMFLILIF